MSTELPNDKSTEQEMEPKSTGEPSPEIEPQSSSQQHPQPENEGLDLATTLEKSAGENPVGPDSETRDAMQAPGIDAQEAAQQQVQPDGKDRETAIDTLPHGAGIHASPSSKPADNFRDCPQESDPGKDVDPEAGKEEDLEAEEEDDTESEKEEELETEKEDDTESEEEEESESREEDEPESREEDEPESREEDDPESREEDDPESREEDDPEPLEPVASTPEPGTNGRATQGDAAKPESKEKKVSSKVKKKSKKQTKKKKKTSQKISGKGNFQNEGGNQHIGIDTQKISETKFKHNNIYILGQTSVSEETEAEDTVVKMPFVFKSFEGIQDPLTNLLESQGETSINFLLRHRVLIIAGYWSNYLHRAATVLNRHACLANYELRQCSMVGTIFKDEPWNWKDLITKHKDWGEKMALTARLDELSADLVMDGLPYFEPESKEITRLLTQNNRYLIFKIPFETLERKRAKHGYDEQKIGVWQLDELSLFFRHHYPHQADELYGKTTVLIDRKRLGNTPRKAMETLAIAHGEGTLLTLLKDGGEGREETKETFAISIGEPKQGPLERLIHYTAVFFPGLPFESFDRILRFLIEKQPKETPDSEFQIERHNAIPIAEPLPMAKKWDAQADEILDSLGLIIRVDGSGQEVVGYQNSKISDRLKQDFLRKKPAFMRRQIELIRYSELVLFGEDNELDLITDLVVSVGARNPDYYCREWLEGLVLIIDHINSQQDNVELSGSLAEQIAQLSTALILKQGREYYFTSRITRVIQRFYLTDEEQKYREAVDGFLKNLLQHRKYARLFEIVTWLNKMRLIDPLPWLRQLLESAHDELVGQVISYLVNLAVQDQNKIFERLQALFAWLPDKKSPVSKYSRDQRCAAIILFRILADLELANIANFKSSTSHPLWGDTKGQNYQLLVDLLFHPALAVVLDEKDDPNFIAVIIRITFSNGTFESRSGKDVGFNWARNIWLEQKRVLDPLDLRAKRSAQFRAAVIQRWCDYFFRRPSNIALNEDNKRVLGYIWGHIKGQKRDFYFSFWETASQAIGAVWMEFQTLALKELQQAQDLDLYEFHQKVEEEYGRLVDGFEKTAAAFGESEV